MIQIGATAFTKHIPEGNEKAWAEFLSGLKNRCRVDHVQFLAPEQEVTARMFSKLCDDLGLGRSTLWCTFHPVCPCAQAVSALDAAKKAIELGRIIAGTGPNVVMSPSLFRGLCDPERGLPEQGDPIRQIAFLETVAEFARTIPETRLAAEPLNRFETRGPNTVAEAARLIDNARAADVVGVLVDSCHQGMEERPIDKVWDRYSSYVAGIHASSLLRGLLSKDTDLASAAWRMVARNETLSRFPVIIEAFCQETNPGFFAPLGVHEPLQITALDLTQRNADWLRSVMN